MQSGRKANQERKMGGCVNEEKKLTDIYLPRKCEYSDRIITSKDRSSIQLSICQVNEDGTINFNAKHLIPISGFVRQKGHGDAALQTVLIEKGLYLKQ